MLENSTKKELILLIRELVEQSCINDSMAISVYAEAMRLLAKEGHCKILHEVGRRVIVDWLPIPTEYAEKPENAEAVAEERYVSAFRRKRESNADLAQ